ncbi:MAG: hypothetical protein P8X51_07975 [Maritimibacter sp.]
MKFGFLLFPKHTQLDLTGPLEVFSRMNNVETALVWKTRDPVPPDRRMHILPTHTFEDARELDLIFVPGGPGQIDLMGIKKRWTTCALWQSAANGSLPSALALWFSQRQVCSQATGQCRTGLQLTNLVYAVPILLVSAWSEIETGLPAQELHQA